MTHHPNPIEAGPARPGAWSAAAGAWRARLATILWRESLIAVEFISQAEEDARLAEIERLIGEAFLQRGP